MSPDPKQSNRKSYENINYNIRPAKSTERKMLCEGFRKLSNFYNIDIYRYIGFGSTYFSDFVLFHRALGINSMFSIEKNDEDFARFEFNKPYKCIEIIPGESNEVLPSLTWEAPTIMWLDYDGHLTASVCEDIGIFFTKALTGSMLVISVNANQDNYNLSKGQKSDDYPKILNEFRMRKLVERVGEGRIPRGTEGKDLNNKNKASVLRKIINSEILEVLSKRNGGHPPENKIHYQQIYNFEYQDGAKMLTVGGLIFEENQKNTYNKCNFESLDFFKPDEEFFEIGIPKLTSREIRFLDKKLPSRDSNGKIQSLSQEELGELSVIPIIDIENYIKIYRFFPNFSETEI